MQPYNEYTRTDADGSYALFKIVVVNRVPEQLDLSTLRAGASSHPYELEITRDNELKWTFNDIMLPDSNASEPNSHGYVKYEIQLKKDLSAGTEIWNAADIYFDYHAPVRTNEVKNVITLQSPTSVGERADAVARLYPNPTSDRVTIASPLLVAGTIMVYNNLGEVVLSVRHTGGARADMNTGMLPAGVYYVSCPVAGGIAAGC